MVIDNTTTVPTVIAIDEHVYSDGEISGNGRHLTCKFDDPDKEINLINPITGETLRKVTYGEVQAIIFSVYKHLVDNDKAGTEDNGDIPPDSIADPFASEPTPTQDAPE
jgi:hypothetical protein